jgi:sarcosine oxidase subunit beta
LDGKTADVIIVGGGVTGLSVALHLKELGAGRVLLLERHHVGAGQSGHAAGIVRGLVGHKAVASMLIESLNFFTNFENEYEEKLAVYPAGFLLLNQSSQSDFLDRVICEAKEAGCTANRISAAEAIELQPGLRQDSDDIYAFEPDAIYVDPMMATQTLARVARRLGVEVVEGCEVYSILKNGYRILGVATPLGKFESDSVVIGTAAWGAAQLAKLGIEVPVYPHRTEMAFFSVWPESSVRVSRILSDARTMLYLRPEGTDQMFVGWREGDRILSVRDFVPADPDNYWQTSNYASLADMSRRLAVTLPFMAEGFVHRTYACVYDYTPDGMPILDRAESVKGLYFSLGYSGGGFSLSPWVGSVMSRFIFDGLKSAEMHLLRLSRFEEGQLLKWGNVKQGLH